MDLVREIIIIERIVKHIEKAKRKNRNYSLNSFADKAGIDRGTLSKIINGKRQISDEYANKIIKCIAENEADKLKLELLTSKEKKEIPRVEIINNNIFSKWYYLAVWSLFQTKNDIKNYSDILKKINISRDELDKTLKLLVELQLLEKTSSFYRNKEFSLCSSENISNEDIRNFHKTQMSLAVEAIDSVDIGLRDISSLIIPADVNLLPKAQQLTRKFQDDIERLLVSGEAKEVYAVNIQIFPLSKVNEENKNE